MLITQGLNEDIIKVECCEKSDRVATKQILCQHFNNLVNHRSLTLEILLSTTQFSKGRSSKFCDVNTSSTRRNQTKLPVSSQTQEALRNRYRSLRKELTGYKLQLPFASCAQSIVKRSK